MRKLFEDQKIIELIRNKLPKLFQIAELESQRAGKTGMEVGNLREKILIALVIHVFGETNVNANIPTTEPEIDVIVNDEPINIKTITGNGGVKACWTVDQESARTFVDTYSPEASMLLVRIFWGDDKPSFFYIPLKVQNEIRNSIGIENFLNIPKPGGNPRGVTFNKDALHMMENHPLSKKISINWIKENVDFNVYDRWLEYWRGEINI